MSSPAWQRPHYRGVGGRPHLWYKVHGTFDGTPHVSASVHRTSGIPDGIDLLRYERDQAPEVFAFGLDGIFGDSLAAHGLGEVVQASPHALVLRGEIDDRASLDYLRDVVGLITALLDCGGVAVFDPLILRWWTPESWRREVFEPDAPVPGRHTVILASDDEEQPGRRWFHTRGMQKFGRPDIGLHGIGPEHEPGAIDACERFIDLLARGAVLPDGKALRLRGLPDGLRCFHEGSAEDPDYNNVHIEIRPPRVGDILADPGDLDLQSLLEPWQWLGIGEATVVAATLLGDLVLENAAGVHVLDTTAGELRLLAASRDAMHAASSDDLDEWFAAGLAFDCLESGLSPGSRQCLSYKIPPVLGGSFDLDNVEVTDLDVHQHVIAQILEQVRDLPDGATIRLITES
jgi:hypothetical protein